LTGTSPQKVLNRYLREMGVPLSHGMVADE
jgi:hypothetical protein